MREKGKACPSHDCHAWAAWSPFRYGSTKDRCMGVWSLSAVDAVDFKGTDARNPFAPRKQILPTMPKGLEIKPSPGETQLRTWLGWCFGWSILRSYLCCPSLSTCRRSEKSKTQFLLATLPLLIRKHSIPKPLLFKDTVKDYAVQIIKNKL